MAKGAETGLKVRVAAENRKARHNYAIEDRFEAGISLTGTEVKSLRFGSATIAEAFVEVKAGEAWLVNAHIPIWSHGNLHNHEPRRPRKLLLHRREIDRLQGAVQRKGMTIVPLILYFNEHGKVKLEIGLARGKKAHDKRESEKTRDWQRQRDRIMREKG